MLSVEQWTSEENFPCSTCASEDRRRAEQRLLWKRRMCHTSGCSWNACEQERESVEGGVCRGAKIPHRLDLQRMKTPRCTRNADFRAPPSQTTEEQAGGGHLSPDVSSSRQVGSISSLLWNFLRRVSPARSLAQVCRHWFVTWCQTDLGGFDWFLCITVSHRLVIVWCDASYFPHMDSIRLHFCFGCFPTFVFLSQNTDTLKICFFLCQVELRSFSLLCKHSNSLWFLHRTALSIEWRCAVIRVLLKVRGRAFVRRLQSFCSFSITVFFLPLPAPQAVNFSYFAHRWGLVTTFFG